MEKKTQDKKNTGREITNKNKPSIRDRTQRFLKGKFKDFRKRFVEATYTHSTNRPIGEKGRVHTEKQKVGGHRRREKKTGEKWSGN